MPPPPENFANSTIWTGDNLHILRGINSESIDLIYLDPPFNSNRNYAAPIGSEAAGAHFKDTWTLSDIDEIWVDLLSDKHPKLMEYIRWSPQRDSDKSYLIYMAMRILEMHRVLKSTGSIYLHCDPTMSHLLRGLLDYIFGRNNFQNEIVWRKYGGRKNNAKRKFSTQNDTILFYVKSNDAFFEVQYSPISDKEIEKKYSYKDETGRKYRLAWGRNYQLTGEQRKIYLDESPGAAIGNLWIEDGLQLNTSSRERTGYPTQKPLSLLERIINASSREGAIVLDPFCGCATTCVASAKLRRKWIGIDISPMAAKLVAQRIKSDLDAIDESEYGKHTHRTDIPQRTDLGILPHPRIHKDALYGVQGGNCNGCGEHFQKQHLEVDHRIAKSVGGTDHIDNLQLLCSPCNRIKGNRGMEYLINKLNLGDIEWQKYRV